MKLKPWLWAGLGVVVIGGGLVVYASMQPPFDFLAGRTASALASADREEMSKQDVEVSIYTFTADWRKVVEEAKPELTAEGFKMESRDSMAISADFYDPNSDAMSRSSEQGRAVIIVKDERYHSREGLMGMFMDERPAKGWVTVIVGEKRAGSLWASFTRWFGF